MKNDGLSRKGIIAKNEVHFINNFNKPKVFQKLLLNYPEREMSQFNPGVLPAWKGDDFWGERRNYFVSSTHRISLIL